MPKDFHHIAVFVHDLNRTLHLFQDILGFEILWRLPKVGGKGLSDVMGVPEMEAEIAYLRTASGGTALELVRIIPSSSGKGATSDEVSNRVVLSLRVEDLGGVYQRLSDEGWTPFTRPVDMMSPEGQPIKMFCFPAESGLTVELFEASGS